MTTESSSCWFLHIHQYTPLNWTFCRLLYSFLPSSLFFFSSEWDDTPESGNETRKELRQDTDGQLKQGPAWINSESYPNKKTVSEDREINKQIIVRGIVLWRSEFQQTGLFSCAAKPKKNYTARKIARVSEEHQLTMIRIIQKCSAKLVK